MLTYKHAGDLETKTQINQSEDFGKPDFAEKRQRQRNRQNFTNSTYLKLCEEKTRQFWEPAKPTTNTTKRNWLCKSKPTLTKTSPKNLDADFSDWMQPTRNFADETKANRAKIKTLKTCLRNKDSNSDLEKRRR